MKEETHSLKCVYNGVQPYIKVTAYELSAVNCSADKMSGYYGEEAVLISDDPQPGYNFSNWSVTGTTLTGNNFKFDGDVTAKANYSAIKYNVTLQNDGHGTIAANKTTGNIGDTITLSNTANSHYGFSGYSVTGAALTGNAFNIGTSNVTAKAWFSALPAYNLTLQTDGNGQIYSDKNTGYSNDVVTLTNTPSAGYILNRYDITGATMTGSQFKFEDQDVTAKAIFTATGYTLTLQNDGHGTISANKVTGFAGDTVTLSTSYNTYYRFNNYSVTGGTINGNTFTFGNGNATAKANFKTNNFTATGKFESGSNVQITGKGSSKSTDVPEKYAIYGAHTGNVPTAWYNTSNRWKPSNVSGYSMTLNTKMTFSGKTIWQGYRGGMSFATGTTMIGTTASNTRTYYKNDQGSAIWNYNETVTTTAQNVNYGISGKLSITASYGQGDYGYATATYIAASSTGTWTATGIAP